MVATGGTIDNVVNACEARPWASTASQVKLTCSMFVGAIPVTVAMLTPGQTCVTAKFKPGGKPNKVITTDSAGSGSLMVAARLNPKPLVVEVAVGALIDGAVAETDEARMAGRDDKLGVATAASDDCACTHRKIEIITENATLTSFGLVVLAM